MKNFLLTLWQLPQCIVGWILLLFYKTDKTEKKDHGVTLHYCPNFPGGISLGRTILLMYNTRTGKPYEDMDKHEYGHTCQSRMLGWLYLIVIGLPSICWAALHNFKPFSNKSYYWFYTERWADKLGGIEKRY